MLYQLVYFSDQISALNVFRYISFRTGGAIFTALLFVMMFVSICVPCRRLNAALSCS